MILSKFLNKLLVKNKVIYSNKRFKNIKIKIDFKSNFIKI